MKDIKERIAQNFKQKQESLPVYTDGFEHQINQLIELVDKKRSTKDNVKPIQTFGATCYNCGGFQPINKDGHYIFCQNCGK